MALHLPTGSLKTHSTSNNHWYLGKGKDYKMIQACRFHSFRLSMNDAKLNMHIYFCFVYYF